MLGIYRLDEFFWDKAAGKELADRRRAGGE